MGVAYYIELDAEDIECDEIDGKSVGRAMDSLDAMATALNVTPLSQFMGQSMDDIGDMLGQSIEMADGTDGSAKWFSPREGLVVIEALLNVIRVEPKKLKGAKAVMEDLEDYKQLLQTAQAAGARWHLAIDF